MARQMQIKTTYEPAKVIQPIFTRGDFSLSRDGRILATCLDEDVLLTDLHTGEELARLEGDGESITSMSLTPTATHLILCSRSLSMRIYSLKSSPSINSGIEYVLERTLKPHTTPVVTCSVDKSGSLLATGGTDGSVKVWDIRGGYITHNFHGHSALVTALHFFEVDASNAHLWSASNPKKRKQFDSENGNINLASEPTAGFRLASGGDDGKIMVWNLHRNSPVATIEMHVSVVRTLDYSPTENALLSGSRDKTIMIHDTGTWKTRLTIPVLEEVETAGYLKGGRLVYTGGQTGSLRIWNADTGKEITQEQSRGSETDAIQGSVYLEEISIILTGHADQTLVLYDTKGLESVPLPTSISLLPMIRRICGSHGQVIDLAFLGSDMSRMALATNSEDVRIISLEVNDEDPDNLISGAKYFGSNKGLLKGHEDIIICMDVDDSGHWLATGAKDNTAKLWRLDPSSDSYSCYTTLRGHTESVSAIAIAQTSKFSSKINSLETPPPCIITGSQDKTVKRWEAASQKVHGKTAHSRATYTLKAHDKDINAIAISPTSEYFASASHDRTVKIWSTQDGGSVGVLRGHRRGVWSVSFSPSNTQLNIPGVPGEGATKGYVLTGCGDKNVRIWSLADFSCLITMEGHTSSVLKVIWLPRQLFQPEDDDSQFSAIKRAPQVASAAGDGLVKIWDAQSGECETSLDNHTDRVWALVAKPSSRSKQSQCKESPKSQAVVVDVTLVSGGGDSVINFWKDTSSATLEASQSRETERIEMDQELQNLTNAKQYRKAIILALQLNHPKRMLQLFTKALEEEDPSSRQVNDAIVRTSRDKDRMDVADYKEAHYSPANSTITSIVSTLSELQLYRLLLLLRDWNTNARNAMVAQRVLRCILEAWDMERLSALKVAKTEKGRGLADVLRGLKAYGERHLARVEELWDESFLLEFTLLEMDALLSVNGAGVP